MASVAVWSFCFGMGIDLNWGAVKTRLLLGSDF